ncbi:MAG TPA: cell division protein SepF [Micromonosporaceae bacterium]|nr:cell division protein SepF [Micromonosporaceae bacterium]
MGALRKAGVWLGLIEDEDDRADDRAYDDRDRGYGRPSYRDGYRGRYADEFADDEDDAEEIEDAPRARSGRVAERTARIEAARAERGTVRSITRPAAPEAVPSVSYPTRENLALAPQVQLRERAVVSDDGQRHQITTLHPTTYREARTIGEHFRDGVPVIINLTEMDEADARRLVDFAAGLAFGLRGTIERVTNRVFLLSPANVQVTAEDKAKIAEGGFFDQS